MVVDSDRGAVAELAERSISYFTPVFHCTCGLELRQRQRGPCRFVFRDGSFCGEPKGKTARQDPSRHLPNAWWAGFDHVDPSPDAPCACHSGGLHHPKHGATCELCGIALGLSTKHGYLPRTIDLDHIAEEVTMSQHCEPVVEELNKLMTAGTPTGSLLSQVNEELGSIAREELAALPNSFIKMLDLGRSDAYHANLPFTLVSEAPPKPIEDAKAGRVTMRFEHDEDGVHMYISHVHGHHASWLSTEDATV